MRTWTDHNSTVGNDTVYAYDAHGRLQDVYELVLNGGAPYANYTGLDSTTHLPIFTGGTPPTTAYTYDLAGNLKTESLPDGVTTTYSYDTLNRLTDLSSQNSATGKLIFVQQYDLRHDGLRNYVVETRYNTPDGMLFSRTKVSWTYDNDGRLIDESETVLDDGTGGTSNANGHAPAPYTNHYTFDLANNRMSKGIAGGVTITYTYSGDDQLSTESDGTTYDTSYGYDFAGNQTSKTVKAHGTNTVTENDTYTWDLRNRMIEVSMTLGTINTDTTYAYDSSGVRVSETIGGASTFYLNDPMNPTGYAKAVEETSTINSPPKRSYVFGLGVEGQSGITSGTQYLLRDGHGSTRALLDVLGAVIQRYDYYAYGEALGFDVKQAETVWLFGGDGLYDPASGFTYNLARWRDGFVFMNQDTVESLHRYLYADNDPIIGDDPSGHFFAIDAISSFSSDLWTRGTNALSAYRQFTSLKNVLRLTAIAGTIAINLLAPAATSEGLVYSFPFHDALKEQRLPNLEFAFYRDSRGSDSSTRLQIRASWFIGGGVTIVTRTNIPLGGTNDWGSGSNANTAYNQFGLNLDLFDAGPIKFQLAVRANQNIGTGFSPGSNPISGFFDRGYSLSLVVRADLFKGVDFGALSSRLTYPIARWVPGSGWSFFR